jgi:hypothetical protein
MAVSEDGGVAEARDGSVGVGEPIIQTFRVTVASGSTSTTPPVDTQDSAVGCGVGGGVRLEVVVN